MVIGPPVQIDFALDRMLRVCDAVSTRDEDGTVWSMAGTCPLNLGHAGPHIYVRRHPDAVRVITPGQWVDEATVRRVRFQEEAL